MMLSHVIAVEPRGIILPQQLKPSGEKSLDGVASSLNMIKNAKFDCTHAQLLYFLQLGIVSFFHISERLKRATEFTPVRSNCSSVSIIAHFLNCKVTNPAHPR